MIRLDKYLSDLGIGTRKEVKQFIKNGYVTVKGIESPENDMKIDENTAEVYFDGEKLAYKSSVYLLMNKPAGVVSATYDDTEKTVIDVLPDEYKYSGLFPVGRLDKDTVGLLLLTNDGAFSHRLTSPKKDIIKTYYAVVTGELTDSDKKNFQKGIVIDGGEVCKPAELYELCEYAAKEGEEFAKLCRKNASGRSDFDTEVSETIVRISEGKYHQVKRMFEAVGKSVVYLKRVSIGTYKLPYDLEEGDVVELEP